MYLKSKHIFNSKDDKFEYRIEDDRFHELLNRLPRNLTKETPDLISEMAQENIISFQFGQDKIEPSIQKKYTGGHKLSAYCIKLNVETSEIAYKWYIFSNPFEIQLKLEGFPDDNIIGTGLRSDNNNLTLYMSKTLDTFNKDGFRGVTITPDGEILKTVNYEYC